MKKKTITILSGDDGTLLITNKFHPIVAMPKTIDNDIRYMSYNGCKSKSDVEKYTSTNLLQ